MATILTLVVMTASVFMHQTYEVKAADTNTIYTSDLYYTYPAYLKTSNSNVENAVKWKKNTVGNGYQIQYSTNKKFTSGNKTVTISKNSTTKKTITGLKKGKTYFVRMRTYKKVGSAKYYSGWSAIKKARISK